MTKEIVFRCYNCGYSDITKDTNENWETGKHKMYDHYIATNHKQVNLFRRGFD